MTIKKYNNNVMSPIEFQRMKAKKKRKGKKKKK
jgi:hypothetical protein